MRILRQLYFWLALCLLMTAVYDLSDSELQQVSAAQIAKVYVITNARGTLLTTYTPDGKPTTPTIELGACFCNGVAVDASRKIYITADSPTDQVKTFLADGKQIAPMTHLGLPGFGISILPNGLIYVLNGGPQGNGTVNTFTPDGKKTNFTLSTDQHIAHFAVGSNGNIYVASQTGNTLKVYDRTGHQTGATITAGIHVPWAVAVAPAGTIYVANDVNVTTYTPEGKQINITLWHNFPSGPSLPKALAIDASGNIYVGFTQGGVGVFLPNGVLAHIIDTPKGVIAMAVH